MIISEGTATAHSSGQCHTLPVVVYLGVLCKCLLGHPLDRGGDGAPGLVQELLLHVHQTHCVPGLGSHLGRGRERERVGGRKGIGRDREGEGGRGREREGERGGEREEKRQSRRCSGWRGAGRAGRLTCAMPAPMSPLPITATRSIGARTAAVELSSLPRAAGTAIDACSRGREERTHRESRNMLDEGDLCLRLYACATLLSRSDRYSRMRY